MKNTPHELIEEFPELAAEIHAAKTKDAHFSKLYEEYHDVNRKIHRAETDIEPMSDEHIVDLRKTRMALKDQLYAALKTD